MPSGVALRLRLQNLGSRRRVGAVPENSITRQQAGLVRRTKLVARFPWAIQFKWLRPRLNFPPTREGISNSLRAPMPQTLGLLRQTFRILFFLAAFLSSAAVAQTVDWVREMKEGNRAFDAKNYALAESHYVSAAKSAESDPSHPENHVVSLYILAQVYCSESKTGEAGRAFELAFEAGRKLSLEPDYRAKFSAAFASIGQTQAAEIVLLQTEAISVHVPPETYSCVRAIAEQGNATAQSALGVWYANGLAGQPKNEAEATRW